MSHNQEPNDKRNMPGNDHDEIRLLRDQINETKQELVRVIERSDERLSLLEQRIGSIESKNLDAALAAHKDETQREINELKEFVTTAPVTVVQHEHSEIQALNTNTQALTTRLNGVETNLEEQKKKFIKKIDRAGIIIGVLGGILAVSTGILTLPKTIKEFRSKPETQLVSGWPLEVSYDPVSRQVGFTFSVKVGNYGGRADTIKEVRASFRPDSMPPDKAYYLKTGIKFTEKGVDVRTPFDVSTSSPRELLCTMTTGLGDNDPQAYIQPGLNRLHVELIGEDDGIRAPADYCFWVMKVQVEDLHAATSLKSFTFVAPYQKCQIQK